MTASRRANPTYYGGDLRRDLLDTALELIAQEGPSAVSLRSLARRLGVSHAAPANHFPDKAALFTTIAVEGFGLLARAIKDGAGQLGPEATAGQRFRAAGRAYTGFALANPAHFAVMWQRDLLHQDDPELAAAGDTTFELLLGSVREIQSEGWAAGSDPQAGDAAAITAEEVKAVPNHTSKMIDLAQVQGQVHAQSVQKVGDLADKNPNETVSIIRTWLHEGAAG